MKTGSHLPRRALATGLAACAHLMILLLLGWKVPRFIVPPAAEVGPAVEITLVRPQIELRREPAPQKSRLTPSPPPASARVLTAPAPPAAPTPITPPPTPTPQVTPAPVPPNLETSVGGQRVRDALRGLIGCTGALAKGLSHEEREACDRKLAAARPAPAGPLYTAKEAEAFNSNPAKESIFVRKPHNACLPHIGNRPVPVPAAVSGAKTTAFGLACGWDLW